MNIFKRLLRIGTAEVHSAVDKMEDPIKMTEQGIREMKEDLEKSLEALARVKALAIRAKNDIAKRTSEAEDYDNKAFLLLSKMQKGELDAEQAERLAKEALSIKSRLLAEVQTLHTEKEQHDQVVDGMQKNIEVLKFNINKWENELRILRARVKVSKATKEVNKQMAQIDNDSTVSMLERMKEKVAEEEALAEAYGELANKNISVDEAINRAIGNDSLQINEDLEAMKKKLGIN